MEASGRRASLSLHRPPCPPLSDASIACRAVVHHWMVADIFRDHGAAWRAANAGHISLNQFKVMGAIERCRTAALGGHVARCADCAMSTSPTTHAAIGTAQNVSRVPPKLGWQHVRLNCCLCGVFILSSRCPDRSPTSRTRTNARSIIC